MCYSKSGKKDDIDKNTGFVMEENRKYVLLELLGKCEDFQSEKSDLEQVALDISSLVRYNWEIPFTPKFHCELAGKGISYPWGASKRIYCSNPPRSWLRSHLVR